MPVENQTTEQPDPQVACCDCEEEYQIEELENSPQGDLVCEYCISENYFWCDMCGDGDNRDYGYWSDTYDCYYCESCYPGEGEDVDLHSHRGITMEGDVEGDTFSSNTFKRMVGVEIETISPDEQGSDQPSSWKRSSDGSISSDNGRGYEYISTPMNGDHLFHRIDMITDYLRRNGFWVNRSCGLHIHIDARDLFYKELKGIMLVMKSFEKTVLSMMPDSRHTTNWCKPMKIDKSAIMKIHNDSDFIESWYDFCNEPPSSDKYNDSRYHGLNLHARVYLGTIEFRYHSGTNNPTKIKNWITICQSIVQKGIEISKIIHDNPDPERWADSSLKKLVFVEDDLGLEAFINILKLDDIKQYIISRVRKFDNPGLYNKDREYINSNWISVPMGTEELPTV